VIDLGRVRREFELLEGLKREVGKVCRNKGRVEVMNLSFRVDE